VPSVNDVIIQPVKRRLGVAVVIAGAGMATAVVTGPSSVSDRSCSPGASMVEMNGGELYCENATMEGCGHHSCA
jgi:hypothetical protein